MISKKILVLVLSFQTLSAFGQKMQVSSNAVGLACLGTLNAEFNYAVSQHWSVGLSGKYNPFTFGDDIGGRQFQLRQRSAAAHARWWPWHVYSGWWLSASARWQEYNMGGILSESTEEGERYGGGLSAGYSHMISPHLNIEFGLGMWGGVKRYTVYACPKCGVKLEEGRKSFVMPSDLIIAVSYVF